MATEILKSEYYDLRMFENKDLTLSQMIYLLQEQTVISIGTSSSFSIWFTVIEGIEHLIFNNPRDVAICSKNNNHLKLPKDIIDTLLR